jgi:hypothetical protein
VWLKNGTVKIMENGFFPIVICLLVTITLLGAGCCTDFQDVHPSSAEVITLFLQNYTALGKVPSNIVNVNPIPPYSTPYPPITAMAL